MAAGAAVVVLGALTTAALIGPASAGLSACTNRVPSDFNGDGYADVAAGGPGRVVDGVNDAGAVRIFYGDAAGLAATGTDQYVDQDSTGVVGAPTEGDEFGSVVASGDFNGDCYADLAIGTPGENDVTILYGSAHGLTGTGAGHVAGNQGGSEFGYALAVGDFNGDGIDDLAAGAPNATDAGHGGAGEIGIAYGGADGLAAPSSWIDQSNRGVPGVAEPNDWFGDALAAGDFTGDGVSDLAAGVPGEDNGSVRDGGSVTILRGSRTGGLTGSGAQLWTQATAGVPGADETADSFGLTLAAGDINGDGRADLVIGAQYEDVGSVADAGSITYLAGAAGGLTSTGARAFTQNTGAIPGAAEARDQFGWSLAVGDFTGDGRGDIAVGTPFEDLGTTVDAGSVTVIPGSSAGPTDVGSSAWDQDTSGVGGAAEFDDDFGFALYAGHITSTGHDDLVVGVPNEASGGPRRAGALNLLRGSAGGLTAAGSQYVPEPGDVAGPSDTDVMGWALG
jgi:hypothetical protein